MARMRNPDTRIPSLDVLRGIAILGTLATNIWIFTHPEGLIGYIETTWGAQGALGWVEKFLQQVSQGKFLGLLTVMFGIGLAIQRESALRAGRAWPGAYPWRAALAAVAILGTVLLTRDSVGRASQEDLVRQTIQTFDTAIQNGDLATLRSITCGATLDSYVKYTDAEWREIHSRVAAAKQYPVVASIDQIVINGDHAEANVTAFMAHAPQTRSTRSFDLQYRDEQWKICQMSQ